MGTPLGDLAVAEQATLDDLHGEVVVIDGHLEFHQYIHSITNDWGDYVTNDDGYPISHLIGLVSRLGKVLDAGIKPIYVFDGGFPELKQELLDDRHEEKENAREVFQQAVQNGNQSKAQAAAHKKNGVMDSMILSGMELLEAMGVPAFRAPGEGEAQAAQLCAEGTASHVVTEDWDALLHGVPSMLRDFGTSGCDRVGLQATLDELGWTHEELRWYGVLRGTDYNESVNGVGTTYGKSIIEDAESFDDVIAEAKTYDTVNEDRWRRALELFDDQAVDEGLNPTWEPFDIERAHNIACVKYGLADWQVTSRLKNVENSEVMT